MAKTPGGECHLNKSPTSDNFDVTVNSSLSELVGFSADFFKELCHRLLRSHSSEDLEFRAGQLCSTAEQLHFYKHTLDAGPMVSRWLETGYEIPFSTVPAHQLSAPNNKSC